MFGIFKKFNQQENWQKWQRGQALVEYWPTFPVGVMVMIAASAIVGPIQDAFQTTADSLNLVVCDFSSGSAYFEMPDGQIVEILASAFDETNQRSTITFRVPADDQIVLGFDEETSDRIAEASETFASYQQDPVSGKWGVKFNPKGNNGVGNGEDPQPPGNPPVNDGEGTSPGNPGNKGGAQKNSTSKMAYRPAFNITDSRDITLSLTGQMDFVQQLEVTVIDSNNTVSTGYLNITVSSSGEDCSSSTQDSSNNDNNTDDKSNNGGGKDKPKGNNGVGNGEDGQPPGNPPINDGEGTSPGNPGNKGGANK